jgi:hypothetical protein
VLNEPSIYYFNSANGAIVQRYKGNEFYNITAATFTQDEGLSRVAYVQGNRLNFLDVEKNYDVGTGTTVIANNTTFGKRAVKAAGIDLVKADNVSVITCYDLTVWRDVLYRLQTESVYRDINGVINDNSFAADTYSYDKTILASYIYAISVRPYPAIITANGSDTSAVTAVVTDQYAVPMENVLVEFSEDDDTGANQISGGGVTPVSGYTDSNGEVTVIFTAGTAEREVKVTAVGHQPPRT